MINHRILIYTYIFIVSTIIFGLSFSVQGDKITGAIIFETANTMLDNFSLSSITWIIFGILSMFAFSIFVIRYAHDIKEELTSQKAKHIAIATGIIIIVSFVGFGLYLGNDNGITGYAVAEPSVNFVFTDTKFGSIPIYKAHFNNTDRYYLKLEDRYIPIKKENGVWKVEFKKNNIRYKLVFVNYVSPETGSLKQIQ